MRTEQSNHIADDLADILRVVTIVSPHSFVFAGHVVSTVGLQGPHPFHYRQTPIFVSSDDERANGLLAQLQNYLYQYCYCTTFKASYPLDAPQQDPQPHGPFVQALSEANSSRDRWDAGWRIYASLPTGQVLAEKGSLLRAVWPGEFLMHGGTGAPPAVGAGVSLYMPRESTIMQPGFYFAFGETPGDWQDDSSIVRFYWNVRATGAAELMRAITLELNRFKVPFRFKSLSVPETYFRRDAAVLFVARRYYPIVVELAAQVHKQIKEQLDEDSPLLTKRLAPGLGFAEDPGQTESFGMSRCRMLAEGLWNAYVQGLQTESARLQAIVECFERYGISLENPYLNAGSTDRYSFPSLEWIAV